MASTYTVEWYNDDGSPTWDTITVFRFSTGKTNPTASFLHPIPIPGSPGTNRSNWHSFRLAWTAPDSQVDNIRHHSDGAIGWDTEHGGSASSVLLMRGNVGVATGSVESDPSGDGNPGTIMTTHASITSTADVESDTAGSPFTLDSTAYTGADVSKHIVLQVNVDENAGQGLKTAETLTLLADEI